MVSSCFSCVFFPAYVFLWKLVHAEARACGHGKTQEKTSFLAFCTAPLPSLRLLPMLDMSPSLSGSQVILAAFYAKRKQPVEQLMKASKCPSRRRGDSWLAFPSFLGQTTSTLLRKLFHVRLNQGFTPLCTVDHLN